MTLKPNLCRNCFPLTPQDTPVSPVSMHQFTSTKMAPLKSFSWLSTAPSRLDTAHFTRSQTTDAMAMGALDPVRNERKGCWLCVGMGVMSA